MFESLKEWFRSFEGVSIFTEDGNVPAQAALAVVLYRVIQADGVISSSERKRFEDLFQTHFNLTEERTQELWTTASQDPQAVEDALEVIDHAFVRGQLPRRTMLFAINRLIGVDGVHPKEMEIFEQAMEKFFPKE